MTSECTHFWVIESPRGRTSLGVCKYCGKTKNFTNTPVERTYNTTKSRAEKEAEQPAQRDQT